MATDDLIDFGVIESSKENIQALPSGRSAKALAKALSPVATPQNTHDANEPARQVFEKELENIDESDDPLDVYDRYVKWTLDTYPSAQATPQSQLLPLLERATKAFMGSAHYKNDSRYLRIWLNYIRFFSDAPRETFAYLARHAIGADLALYYEEFAAWLEGAARWSQAEEVYKMGIEREARPVERLMRKFGEFEQRNAARPQDATEPSSPALPAVRPALAAKFDPLSTSSSSDGQRDPQAGSSKPALKKNKLEIFADDSKSEGPAASGSARGWNSMGTTADRKKENTVAAKPWTNEGMKSTSQSKAGTAPKMMIFKDPTMSRICTPVPSHPIYEQRVRNERTGRFECVSVALEKLYPDPEDPSFEVSFDELMLQKTARYAFSGDGPVDIAREPLALSPIKDLNARRDMPASHTPKRIALNDAENDENAAPLAYSPTHKPPRSVPKKSRKGDKDNKTRQIVMREVRGDTQTIQTNFSSPQGPKMKRKKSSEPTMTLHSKAAQDEMYDIFNAPLASEATQQSDAASDSSSEEDSADDEEYTTDAGESTGHLSATASEYGDETKGDLTTTTNAEEEVDGEATATATATGTTDATSTGWTDFDTRRDVPQPVEDAVTGGIPSGEAPENEHEPATADEENRHDEGELLTPTSPTPSNPAGTMYVPIPPADYEPQRTVNPYRDPEQNARNRLPFMTPIVEKTESSLGAATAQRGDTENLLSKTPCPKGDMRVRDLDDVPGSSPFQALLQDEEEYDQKPIAMPKLEGLVGIVEVRDEKPSIQAKPAVSATGVSPSVAAMPVQRKETKGPIIKDKQCNPMDESVHSTILAEMHPPLSTFKGYFAHEEASNRRAEIKKFCKAVKSTPNAAPGPVLNFPGTEKALQIKRELGAGAYAPVYLAEPTDDEPEQTLTTTDMLPSTSSLGMRSSRLEAVKMEEPPTAWEFYMLRAAKRRLGVSRAADSLVDAYEFHAFADECFLVLEYRAQGTLLDLVNAAVREHAAAGAQGPGALEEPLAMFFGVELLRTVEALHAKGVIHGDLKADNVLVRLDDTLAASGLPDLAPRYARDGTGGWCAKGIALIDFGRGIDMRAFAPGVAFIADWPTGPTDCAEMRDLRPWTFQADYHGLAAILHTLLFGRYIDTVAERGGGVGPGAAKTWKVRESLKRYWQVDIWADVFHLLLNSGRCADAEEGGRLPALRGLRAVRERMEAWLEANCERGVGLKTLVRRAEALVSSRRR